jgi:hypothetical protein
MVGTRPCDGRQQISQTNAGMNVARNEKKRKTKICIDERIQDAMAETGVEGQ